MVQVVEKTTVRVPLRSSPLICRFRTWLGMRGFLERAYPMPAHPVTCASR